jgi:2-phosphoglycerate kinase
MSGRRRDPLPLGEPGGLPYSKGLMARALVAAGVPIEPAYLLAKQLELDLAVREARAVSFDHLEERAAELLGEEEGPRIVLRLRRFASLQSIEMPIVLLVGGATGTG